MRAFVGLDQSTDPVLIVLLEFSYGNIGVPIRPLPSERCRNSVGRYIGSCGILDLPRYGTAVLENLRSLAKSDYSSTAAHDKYVAYGALYLMVPGLNATTPILSAWLANNSEPYYRRATSIAVGFIAAISVLLFFDLIPCLLRSRLTHSHPGRYP